MPKPKFALCCESFSHDKTSNLISLFSVLEGFQLVAQPGPPPKAEPGTVVFVGLHILKFTGVAVWEQSSEAEAGDEFDYVIELHVPGIGVPLKREGRFRFDHKRHYRFTASFEITAGQKLRDGDIRFVSKVRSSSSNATWKQQEYAFPLTIVKGEAEGSNDTGNPNESTGTPA